MFRPKKRGMNHWSKENTCMLIEELKKHPLLYDKMHPLYQQRVNRLAAIRQIIANLKPVKHNITADMITKKLKVLRHQYYTEKSCVENPPEQLIDQYGKYQPRLWCYELMKFLDKGGLCAAPQSRATCIQQEPEEIETQDDLEDNYITDEISNDPFEEVRIERMSDKRDTATKNHSPKRDILHNKCLKLVESLSKEIRNTATAKIEDTVGSSQNSPKTFLGQMVDSELSTVSEDIYHDAKWRIIRILEEATSKERDRKVRSAQNNSQSTSITASTSIPNSVHNADGENGVTVLQKALFQNPMHAPMRSHLKIVTINPPNLN